MLSVQEIIHRTLSIAVMILFNIPQSLRCACVIGYIFLLDSRYHHTDTIKYFFSSSVYTVLLRGINTVAKFV